MFWDEWHYLPEKFVASEEKPGNTSMASKCNWKKREHNHVSYINFSKGLFIRKISSDMRTHCLQGVNLPVRALRASWATVPPKKAERGAKQPPEVALEHRNKDSSTSGISTDICARASFAKETMTSASRVQLVIEINCLI